MGWQDRDYHRVDPEFSGGFGARLRGASMVGWLLGINVIVYILDSILSHGMRSPWWLSPVYWGRFTVEDAIYSVQLWRFGTYQFLHHDFFHLLMNMIGLFFFGPMIEKWWGSRRFLVFYLLCGACGAVLFALIVLVVPGVIFDLTVPGEPAAAGLVGASGATFGILVACAVLYPHQRVMLLLPPIPMAMRTMALLFLGIAAMTLIFGAHNAGGEAAHLGGALLGYLLVKNPRRLDWVDRISPSTIQGSVTRGRVDRQQRREHEHQAEVDRILDKVSRQGLQSLSHKEKKTLNQATAKKRRV